jgi:ubiquinone/menaquinone biosynthesis C-methylase UbiE
MKKVSTADHWKKYWKRDDHQPLVVHRELVHAISGLRDIKGSKILEIGAGMGGDSIYLAERGASVYALDFTDEALKEVSRNAKIHKVIVNQVKADAHHIPFANDYFDVVFHQGFLEHFTDPGALLKEQVRVLKSGGLLVVDVPQRYTMYTLKKHLAMMRGTWFAGWEREFSIRELTLLMKRNNLDIKKTYGWGYYGKLGSLRNMKLGRWYDSLWQAIERSPLSPYLYWCIGAVGQKR